MLSGNSIGQIVPLIVAPILGRIYLPEDFAVQANFIAIVSLIGIISAGRFDLAFVLPKKNKHAQTLFIISSIILSVLFILSILIYVFREAIGKWYDDDVLPTFLIFVPIALFSYAFYNMQANWMLRERKFALISMNRIVQSITNNGVAVLLGYLGWGVSGLIYGWILSNLISIVMFLPAIRKSWVPFKWNRKFARSLVRKYKDFPTINSLHAFTDILASQFLIFWLITHEFGALVLGLFSIMNRYVRAPIQLVSSAVSQLYYSEASKKKREKKDVTSIQNRTLKTALLFALPFGIIVLLFGPTLFSWYLGEKWKLAGVFAQIMAPALFFQFLTSPISATPIIFNKQKQAFGLSVLGYAAGLIVLFGLSQMNYSFEKVLIGYSIVMSLYYITLITWYLYLAKKDHHATVI